MLFVLGSVCFCQKLLSYEQICQAPQGCETSTFHSGISVGENDPLLCAVKTEAVLECESILNFT